MQAGDYITHTGADDLSIWRWRSILSGERDRGWTLRSCIVTSRIAFPSNTRPAGRKADKAGNALIAHHITSSSSYTIALHWIPYDTPQMITLLSLKLGSHYQMENQTDSKRVLSHFPGTWQGVGPGRTDFTAICVANQGKLRPPTSRAFYNVSIRVTRDM